MIDLLVVYFCINIDEKLGIELSGDIIEEVLQHRYVFCPLSDKIRADVATVKGTFSATQGEIRREKQASGCQGTRQYFMNLMASHIVQ